jgi:hypothetical protein
MKYEIRSSDLKKTEKVLKDFIKDITPEVEDQMDKKIKQARQKFKEIKNKELNKQQLLFSIERKSDYILFTDPAPESPIGFMKKRAGKKMAEFLENTLKKEMGDIEVKWIKGC